MSFKKKKISFISLALAAAMIIGLFSGLPFTAYALEYVEGDTWIGTDGQIMSAEHASQWRYVITSDGKGIILSSSSGGVYAGYTGTFTEDGQINGVIPATINGLPVESLAGTFRDKTELKIVPELPDTVTDMRNTFYGCSNLTGEIFISDSVKSLDSIFSGTSKSIVMKYTKYNAAAVNYSAPNNVAKVLVEGDAGAPTTWIDVYGNVMGEKDAALWTTGMEEGGLRYIGHIVDGRIVGNVPASIDGKPITKLREQYWSGGYAYRGTFEGLTGLVYAPKLPDTVTDMSGAFKGCTNLKTIDNLPVNLNNMYQAFYGCSSLDEIGNIPAGVITMDYAFTGSGIKKIGDIPDSVTNMESTFSDCTRLTTVGKINASVANMKDTFYNCSSLTAIGDLPASLKNMYETFYGCSNLASIGNLPAGLEYMYYAFARCVNLSGEIFIPDSATYINQIFYKTSKPITMFYNTSNTAAANEIVPANVTKVGIASQEDFENSKPVENEPQDESITVSVSTTTDDYSVEVGETLQFKATVSRGDLQYKWAIQDLFDTNGQDGHFATIDSTGKVTGIEAGYVIVGLMVKFEDDSEHAYGLTLVEVTANGKPGYSGNNYYTIPGSYVGGWNYNYGCSASLGSWFDASSGGLTVDGSLGGGGTGGPGGSGGGTSPYPSESNAVTNQDKQIYEPSTTVSGELFDKTKNYLKVGNSTQIEVINLNPTNINYKLVSKSLSSKPSVLINQAGVAVGNYEGVSLILLLDEKNKIIDTMLMYVGNTDSLDAVGEEALNNASDDPNDYGFITEVSNNPDNTLSIEVIGLVEPITTLNVAVPLNISFTIDENRHFIAPTDVKIISNCPAPLRVSINNVEKGLNAPNLVPEDTFTDQGWNNLSRKQTSENIALSINGKNLTVLGSEIGTLKSGFREPTELDINITSKYGKAWNNTSDLVFTYSLVLLVEMQ